jgi:hypothetical protein
LATRRKKTPQPIVKKFIMVSQAVYLNQYVVHANSMEEAEAIWNTIKDSEEEGDMICVQQLMDEQVIDCKEAN